MTRLNALTRSLGFLCLASAPALAQAPANGPARKPSCLPQGFFTGPASYKSVEPLGDGRVTFRLCAPDAANVIVTSSDNATAIPFGMGGGPVGVPLTKDSLGLWTGTTAV